MRIRNMALWIVAICLSSAVALEAQPGGRRGSSGGGMGGGVTPEQVFGLLAFDEKFKVTDQQLLALREVLGPLYVEQRQMMAEMFSGGETDFRALREKMREQQSKMREKMMAALATTLDAEQIEALKAHLQQAQRQQQRQRGGPRGGGGGPGGGGF